MKKYSTVAIADINQRCKYQGVTCYGEPKTMDRTAEMIERGSHPNGYISYGWMMVDNERVEIKNADYTIKNVATKNAY